MTRIYMVRHCEALGNLNKLFQGTSDFDITESGAEQLEYLTIRFKDIHLDKVYSSPLIRTQKTAKAVIGTKKLKPIIHDNLIEIDGGIFEGKHFLTSCAKYPELADAWNNHPEDFAPDKGEPMRVAYERIWKAISEIVNKNKGKTVACAAHGGVIRLLLCRIIYNDITKLKNVSFSDNTAVSLIEFDDDFNPTLIYMNDISHLPQDVINKITPVVVTSEV